MTRALLIIATLAAVPAGARADAHETSIHIEATGGVAALGDPGGGDAVSVGLAGAAVRFTWASLDWLAWEVEAYGAGTAIGAHTAVDMPAGARDFSRRAFAAGLDAGATLRLGVAVVPTLAVAVGPQLRLLPSTPLIESSTGRAVADLPAETAIDLTGRISAGIDLRLGARWLIGARASARQALGLDGGTWRSFEGMVHASYYWYPRWWTF